MAAKLLDNAGYLASAVVEIASTTKTGAVHAETQRGQTQVASSNLVAMTDESSKVTAKVEQMDRNSYGIFSLAIEEMSASIRSVADRANSNDQAGGLGEDHGPRQRGGFEAAGHRQGQRRNQPPDPGHDSGDHGRLPPRPTFWP